MSAEKQTDAKVYENSEEDSGFLSGPIDRLPGDSGLVSEEFSGEIQSDEKKVQSASVNSSGPDSAVVMISECLSDVKLIDIDSAVPAVPTLPANTRPSDQLPPLSVLFQPDEDGDTQLHIAAEHGCEKAVSILVRVCPDREWLDIPNDYGQTALHLAALSGNAVVTRMLVLAGASLAVRDHRGETPLHKATILKDVDCIKALLGRVKELPQRKLSTVLDQKNYNGQGCVHLAAAAGHIDTLKALLYYGADINAMEHLAGWTALHIAAQRGDAATARFLRERADVCVRARDYAGRTPRRLARRSRARSVFDNLPDSSDSESDSDDDYDSDGETLFEKVRETLNPTAVA